MTALKTLVNRVYLYHDPQRPLQEWVLETFQDTPSEWVLVDHQRVFGNALAAWNAATAIRMACGHARLRFFA